MKPHENLTDLIDQSLKADLHKGYSSTNRLLNRFDTFTKDWEVLKIKHLKLYNEKNSNSIKKKDGEFTRARTQIKNRKRN